MPVPDSLCFSRWFGSDAFWQEYEAIEPSVHAAASLRRLRHRLPRRSAEFLYELAMARPKLSAKFPSSPRLLATRRALEQATDERIAEWKARRFAQATKIVDFCSGMGGDAIALARHCDRVLMVDRSIELVHIARYNTRISGLDRARGVVANCEDLRLSSNYWWHLDPDRRASGRRSSETSDMSPHQDWIDKLRSISPHGAIKLAPQTTIPDAWLRDTERCWVSHRGECRQQVVWCGALARHRGKRSAVCLDGQSAVRVWVDSGTGHRPRRATRLGCLLLETDPALLASSLVHDFAAHHSLALVTVHGGYLTADHCPQIARGWVRMFRVETQLPMRIAKIRQWCRQHGRSVSEVKQRGTHVDPAQWLHRLKRDTPEGRPCTIIATRIADRFTAVVAERINDVT